MPPKRSANGSASAPPCPIQAERLKGAVDKGILVRDGSPQSRQVHSGMRVTDKLLKANGKDIVKKGATNRKSRILLVFGGWVSLAQAGKLGTITDVNSPNPTMYITFPEGRLKLLGTIVVSAIPTHPSTHPVSSQTVARHLADAPRPPIGPPQQHPSSRFALLNLQAKKSVTVEEVFDSMVVFTEAFWVGTPEENPDERRLPIPDAYDRSVNGDGGTFHSIHAPLPPFHMAANRSKPLTRIACVHACVRRFPDDPSSGQGRPRWARLPVRGMQGRTGVPCCAL